MYTKEDHTFVLCAYRESRYLEECVQSLLAQENPSQVVVATSTPNEGIRAVCEKYHLPLRVNPEQKGIAYDWNFACAQAQTVLVTVAHQDDRYEPGYVRSVVEMANRCPDALLIYTDYYEIRGSRDVHANGILRIKRLMNWPLSFRCFWSAKWMRRLILAFGCPICCPSVTLVRKKLADPIFDTRYKNSCDYKTWVMLSGKDGGFVYCPRRLMGHRIYAESSTSKNIQDQSRSQEDLEILGSFWPKPVGRAIFAVYRLSQKSNRV